MIQILLADDQTILRQGLRLILDDTPDFEVVGEATTGEDAVKAAVKLQPDIVLSGIKLPVLNGIEATRRIRSRYPHIHVLILTISAQEHDLLQAVKAGAKGYLLKNADASQVKDAIRRVVAGEVVLPPKMMGRILDEFANPASQPPTLTRREVDTLALLGKGRSNKEIAASLRISQNTVKTHVRHILEKLNLNNRAEAAAYVVRANLVAGN